uniref:SGNH hydrolase-type esterase domain-containing protein n=1 Tax=Mastacembelus armatus TaxID=205130 RepID=A0A7N8XT48_9TELE
MDQLDRGSPLSPWDLSNPFAPLSSATPDLHTASSANHVPDRSAPVSQQPPSPANVVQRRHLLSLPSDDTRRPRLSPSAPRGALRRRILRESARRHDSNSQLLASSPRPLFPPTTLIIGDSIIRNVRFFNATTHCLPGAMVSDILAMLPGLLPTLPSSISRVIVHIGTCDTSLHRSELTKKDFISLLHLLSNCGKTIFMSGPIPTFGRGSGRFSRILSLNTWIKSVSLSYNLQFIDNFNLFWNRPAFFAGDGLHPNRLVCFNSKLPLFKTHLSRTI